MSDLLAVIREKVPLVERGDSYVARCPFHAEHTPSFYVNPERGLFHCFGCGVGGDSATFLGLWDARQPTSE